MKRLSRHPLRTSRAPNVRAAMQVARQLLVTKGARLAQLVHAALIVLAPRIEASAQIRVTVRSELLAQNKRRGQSVPSASRDLKGPNGASGLSVRV